MTRHLARDFGWKLKAENMDSDVKMFLNEWAIEQVVEWNEVSQEPVLCVDSGSG